MVYHVDLRPAPCSPLCHRVFRSAKNCSSCFAPPEGSARYDILLCALELNLSVEPVVSGNKMSKWLEETLLSHGGSSLYPSGDTPPHVRQAEDLLLAPLVVRCSATSPNLAIRMPWKANDWNAQDLFPRSKFNYLDPPPRARPLSFALKSKAH